MITGISIKNFKAIKTLDGVLRLQRFHVLVGPNGSGKSTFLEAVDFVKDCLQQGPRKAVEIRVPEFRDLTFMRQGGTFEFICLEKLKRSLSPRDFEEMGKIASIRSMQESSSFAKIVTLLQDWFPIRADADEKASLILSG